MQEELQQDARDHQHGDDLLRARRSRSRGHESQRHQRPVGDAVAGMNRVQKAEVVAVACGGVRHARVAEQQREDTEANAVQTMSAAISRPAHAPKAELCDVGDQLQAQRAFVEPGPQPSRNREWRKRGEIHGDIEDGETKRTESRIARGMVRSGWRTSLPRKEML